jgi:DNA-binding winged helix-turn-helix (wHTH) protein
VLPNQNRIEGPDGADHLEPKVMEVLCQLARNQGEVVSRRQLMETVWRDTVVGDEVLSFPYCAVTSAMTAKTRAISPQYPKRDIA